MDVGVFITGDTHGDFDRVEDYCKRNGLTSDDIVVILGDVGLNYRGSVYEAVNKERLAALGPTFFCIHGNHEMRPHHLPSYHEVEWRGGKALMEEAYPSILFPKDGEVFDLSGGGACWIVIGGAYSVDKNRRLLRGWTWFEDEQPDDETKARVEEMLDKLGWKIDFVLSHTCPLKYEPVEVFLSGIDQSTVDKSTEEWLGKIEERLDYKRWYCGHFHVSKQVDRMRFMFEDWMDLSQKERETEGGRLL